MRISDWSSDMCSSDLLKFRFARACRQRATMCWPGNALAIKRAFLLFLLLPLPCLLRACSPVLVRLDVLKAPSNDPLHRHLRSEEHPSELQSLMSISYAVCCMNKKIYRLSTVQTTTTYFESYTL